MCTHTAHAAVEPEWRRVRQAWLQTAIQQPRSTTIVLVRKRNHKPTTELGLYFLLLFWSVHAAMCVLCVDMLRSGKLQTSSCVTVFPKSGPSLQRTRTW